MKLSDSEIAGYAKGAGLSGNAVAIAVAVALAESSGETTSHNPYGLDDSYGLWQINMLGSMGPARRAQFGISSNDALYNPATNAKAMAILSNQGNNWLPWTTYTRGTYRAYLDRGKTAAGSSGATTDVQTVGLVELGGISRFASMLSSGALWFRLGVGLAGFIVLYIALFRLTGGTARLTAGAKLAANFIPGGKVATAAKAVVK